MITRVRPYERVAEGLRSRIASGEWLPGQMIPGRRDLSAQYGVAAATLERAVGMLMAEGIMSASDRRGTFVARTSAAEREPIAPPSLSNRQHAAAATVGIIASIVPYESSEMRAGQWPAQILAACEHCLACERGLTQRFLDLQPAGGASRTPSQAMEQLLNEGVAAVVVIANSAIESLLLADRAGIPAVCADYDPIPATVPQVFLDSEAGGALAARHLRERGYRGLTFLRPFRAVWAEARLSGARAAAGAAGLRVYPAETTLEIAATTSAAEQRQAGQNAARSLLGNGFPPGTGVIAPNDSVAMGFMAAARERGLEAGRDYGIVGFDDQHREAHLTSLRPPLEQLGREAASLALRLLRNEAVPTRVALQHQLIARASTSPALGGNGEADKARGRFQ